MCKVVRYRRQIQPQLPAGSPTNWPQLKGIITIEMIKLKGLQLDAFCSQAVVYCYIEFKLSYLKNMKWFPIKVKELFGCAEDYCSYISSMWACVQKNFQIWFFRIPPNFTYSQKSKVYKHILNFLDQLRLPYKFYGYSMRGLLFFNFASCESLSCSWLKVSRLRLRLNPAPVPRETHWMLSINSF